MKIIIDNLNIQNVHFYSMKFKKIQFCALLGILSSFSSFGSVVTSFDGLALDPNVHIDIPAGSSATYALGNGDLRFQATGNIDMWNARNGAPFAWTAKPLVGTGGSWYAETHVSFNTPAGSLERIAGFTLYDGPDGAGGASAGMDFQFGLDQWDSPSGVWVQGLGDNLPGDSLTNLTSAYGGNSAFLRMEVTQLSVGEHFNFMYKADSGDAWTSLGSLNANFADSRVALFLKGSGYYTGAQDVSFSYLNVGAIPEFSSFGLTGIGLMSAMFLRRRRTGV